MTILYLLIPLALIIMAIAIAFFLWSVKSGQYEDLEGPAYRILMDDDDPRIPRPNGDRPEQKPGEQKPGEQKPGEQKPGEQKPGE